MAYNNAIPGANDLLSQSQSDIQTNFAEIQTLVGINHINFGAANQGKHLYLQLPEHAAPATAIDEAGLYANVGTTSTVTELFFRRENNGATIAFTEATLATTGWTRLPSGLLMKWGQTNLATNTGATLNFVGPVFGSVPYSVTVTGMRNANADPRGSLKSFTTTQITVYNSSAADAITVFYIALGV